MSPKLEKYRTKLTEVVTPYVSGEVRGVGLLTRGGGMGTTALMKVSPLAATLFDRNKKKASGGLPRNVLIAVTDQTVHVFDYKPRGTNYKIKKEVATWDRSAVRVEVQREGILATSMSFHLADGEIVNLDSPRMPGQSDDFNSQLFECFTAAGMG